MEQKNPPRVFISYSHDSSEHEMKVCTFANRLREDGIEALIDQYCPNPPDGWPIWMEREIDRADFILVICSPVYLRRAERRESPGKGRGALWETKLIYNHLYSKDYEEQRLIPVLFDGAATTDIPSPYRGLTHYRVNTLEGYETLYRHLTYQPRVEVPHLGRLKPLPPIQPRASAASSFQRSLVTDPTASQVSESDRAETSSTIETEFVDSEAFVDQVQASMPRIDETPIRASQVIGEIRPDLNSPWQHPFQESLSTGFKALDSCGFALHPGWLTLVAGESAVGVKTLQLDIVLNTSVAAPQAKSVIVFTFDTTRKAMVLRLICKRAWVDPHKVRAGFVARDDKTRLDRAAAEIAGASLFVDDCPMSDFSKMLAKLHKLKSGPGLDLVVIDNLSMWSAQIQGAATESGIGVACNRLKQLARTLNVSVLLGQILNPEQAKGGERPLLTDLRSIEAHIDSIAFLHREPFNPRKLEDPQHTRELIVAKNPFGPASIAKLGFCLGPCNFVDIVIENEL